MQENNLEIKNPNTLNQSEDLKNALDFYLCTGNMAKLNYHQQAVVIKQSCIHYGLEPIFRPFELIDMQGIKRLYLTKAGTDMLACVKSLNRKVISYEIDENCIGTAIAEATDKEGRTETQMACLFMGKYEERFNEVTKRKEVVAVMKKGQDLANAKMKLYSIALRRVTLGFIGFPDNEIIEDAPPPQKIQNPLEGNVTYTTKEREPEKRKEVVLDTMTDDLNTLISNKKEDVINNVVEIKKEEVTEIPVLPIIEEKTFIEVKELENEAQIKEVPIVSTEKTSLIGTSLEIRTLPMPFPPEEGNLRKFVMCFFDSLVSDAKKGYLWHKENATIFEDVKKFEETTCKLPENVFNDILIYKQLRGIQSYFLNNQCEKYFTDEFKSFCDNIIKNYNI